MSSMDSGGYETEEDSAPEACVSPEGGPSLPSNSREMRNRAEKMRRDKLNSFIKELASLVPICSESGKRMDKTTVLRLAAAFLRLHQLLLRGNSASGFLKSIDQFHLEQLVFEQRKGFLLILTASGKIVFVSYSVQHILGHLQTDLMGQSIYNITLNEDHERLRNYLNSDADINWKKCTLTLRLRRAGTRTESPAFETVSIMGLQSPKPPNYDSCASSPSSSTTSSSSIVSTSSSINGDLWVLFVQNYRPEPLSEKLIQASKDEYVTRHLVDGRIINCDQRISVITGYMSEEVSGLSAFNFMHKEDVRWVMIALRQMYDKGENTGNSCYRLLARNGQFIYLKTFGFLEVDGTDTVESFICVNCLVPEDEGESLIQKMKERYSALVKNTSIAKTNESSEEVENPKSLQQAIIHLLTDLPSTDADNFIAFSPTATMKLEMKSEFDTTDDFSSISSSSGGGGNAIMPSSTTSTVTHNNNSNNNNKKKTGYKRLQTADNNVLSSSSSNKRHKPILKLQNMKQMKVDNDNR